MFPLEQSPEIRFPKIATGERYSNGLHVLTLPTEAYIMLISMKKKSRVGFTREI